MSTMDFSDCLIPVDSHCCECGDSGCGLWLIGGGKALCESCRQGRNEKAAILLTDSLLASLFHRNIIKAMQDVLTGHDRSGCAFVDAVRAHSDPTGNFAVMECTGPQWRGRKIIATFDDKLTAEEIASFMRCHVHTEIYVSEID